MQIKSAGKGDLQLNNNYGAVVKRSATNRESFDPNTGAAGKFNVNVPPLAIEISEVFLKKNDVSIDPSALLIDFVWDEPVLYRSGLYESFRTALLALLPLLLGLLQAFPPTLPVAFTKSSKRLEPLEQP